MILTLSLSPASVMASTVLFVDSMATVSRPLIPTISGACSLMASTNLWGGTSTPRSTMSKPSASRSATTMFFPMSCTSPSTVPMTILPFDSVNDLLSWGLI